MARFGFVGQTYTTRSISADGERCIDLYPEPVGPNATGKSPMVLYSRPGLLEFANLPTSPVRALFHTKQRMWAIAGSIFYEVFSNGTYHALGDVGSPNSTAAIVSNGQQLFIRSGVTGWISDLSAAPSLTQIVFPFDQGISSIAFIDGYFAASVNGTRQFNLSNLLDGLTWDPLMFATKEGASDPIIGIRQVHDDLWLQGSETSEVWSNTGNANFPFQKDPSLLMQEGLASESTSVVIGDTIYWLEKSARGRGIVLAAEGFQPQRVSNYSIEFLISQYPTIEDAIAYPYEEGGHVFLVLYFPSGNATLAYDLTTGMWHERGWWNAPMGKYDAHRGRCHTFVFGKNLIGDRETGLIYNQNLNYFDDNGTPIRRLRSAPHISQEMNVMRHIWLQIDMQVGIGLQGSAGTWNEETQTWDQEDKTWDQLNNNQAGVNPQVMMQFSDDGGYTWSNEKWMSAGKVGQFKRRVKFWGLGSSRDRCYRVAITDPVPICFVDAYLNVIPGNGT